MTEIKHLRKPEIDLKLLPNADGSISISIALGGGDSESQIPLREVARKHLDNLEAAVRNELIAEGIPFKLNKFAGDISTEMGGKTTIGGKGNLGVDGKVESGGVARLAGGKASGGLNGGGELNGGVEVEGKAGIKLSFDIQPNAHLSRDAQARIRDVLVEKSDRIFLEWAKDHCEAGTSLNRAKGQSPLKVTPEALKEYVDKHTPMMERLINRAKGTSDAGSAPENTGTCGFSDPAHPYHRMYAQALEQLGPLASKLGGRPGEDVAAALVLSAANAKLDPDKPMTVATGTGTNTIFAIQGDPASPASRNAMVDLHDLHTPNAQQVALLQTPAAADQQQADMHRASSPVRT